jgi:hypothetical protein
MLSSGFGDNGTLPRKGLTENEDGCLEKEVGIK